MVLLLGILVTAMTTCPSDTLPFQEPTAPAPAQSINRQPAVLATEDNPDGVPTPVLPVATKVPPPDGLWPTLDRYHALISDEVQRQTLRLDSFFIDNVADAQTPSCTVKLRLSTQFKYKDGFDVSPGAGLNTRVTLPHLERKLHVFVDNIEHGQLPGTDFPFSDNYLSAGLRLNPFRRYPSLLSVDGGVEIDPWPALFALIQLRHAIALGYGWTVHLKQQGFRYKDDGFGELSQIDFEQPYQRGALFRSTSAAKWTEESDGVEMEQTFTWEIPLKINERSIAPSATLFWHKESAMLADNYRVNITCRTRIFRTWLFFEIKPQIEFPRDNNFEFTPSIRFNVDVFFNGSPFK